MGLQLYIHHLHSVYKKLEPLLVLNNHCLRSTYSMSSRQPHRKSRTGCQKCKQRKVRCGQEKPICNNCDRLGHHCSFVDSDLLTAGTSTIARSRSASVVDQKAAVASELSSRDPDLQDLELMHQYATSTCFTMTGESEPLPSGWKIELTL